ncbi:YgcG family protein [Bacillus sp. MRMR6]|uniref:TPM domain-containing protein n=1 Tax=Bacillus sp. MRMR6 TaxID=1928617 RepID=UPI000950E1B7|nr:TPM domain-containing protein [Bacillus sp. MRMR6]OLS41045.1 hypothetical protein BTR25_06910 [Bacillus sp. MRMR6]
MPAIRISIFVLLLFIFTGTIFAEEIRVPAPVGDIYIQDFANILTEPERAELRQIGRTLEDQTTAQVAVLTVETIGEQTIEQFANQAFRQYGIGGEAENNGVLLVVSTNDRYIKIEVGYGLEGRIPDGKAGRILDEYAIPYLQSEQPNQAIIETYKALVNEVLAEYSLEGLQSGEAVPQPPVNEGIGIPSWLLIIIVVVVLFLDFKFFGGTLTYLLLSMLSRGRGGGGGGPRGGGGGSSGGGGASRGW